MGMRVVVCNGYKAAAVCIGMRLVERWYENEVSDVHV